MCTQRSYVVTQRSYVVTQRSYVYFTYRLQDEHKLRLSLGLHYIVQLRVRRNDSLIL